jgi:hypothetical protein
MTKITKLACVGLTSVFLLSCGNNSDRKSDKVADKPIVQQADGTISLKLANAECYSDVADPSNNTAEWNVVISKAGSYKVWLSSATRDTVHLNYSNSVKVNLPDSQLVVIPVCDKIVHNSEGVSYPYFRADSYMGSFYFAEPGEYNIQVISEKVGSKAAKNPAEPRSEISNLMAVILSPAK